MHAQDPGPRPRGLEVGVFPALNFDADEGFGYGAMAELYEYGSEGVEPYRWSLRPTLFLTTKGRRDATLFFDAPHLLPPGWRLDAFVGFERQLATPYYGLGNATGYDPSFEAEDGPNPYYYRFGRERRSATLTLQREIRLGRRGQREAGPGDTGSDRTTSPDEPGASPLRWLVGVALVSTEVDPVPEDRGTTLYAAEVVAEPFTASAHALRAGLVWDTRDQEVSPRRGSWSDLLVQVVDERLGADASYLRWTLTDRRYIPLGERVVLAHRSLLQGVGSGAPAHELFQLQSSFRPQEGLGGARTVRGVLKNRFVGRGMVVWNTELRARLVRLRLLGRETTGTAIVFVDHGRVWEGSVRLQEVVSDLHRGTGVGGRVSWGPSFVAGGDLGWSSEGGVGIYLGLGYLF